MVSVKEIAIVCSVPRAGAIVMTVDANPVHVGDVLTLSHHTLVLLKSYNSGKAVDGEPIGTVLQAADVVVR